jgi:uncharacterized protein with PIN domain
MKCPECNKELRWVGDQSVEENIIQLVYDCDDCNIEVIKTKVIETLIRS